MQGQENVGFRVAVPEGAIDLAPFAVCLKAYSDTTRSFSAASQAVETSQVHLGTSAAVTFLLPRFTGNPKLENRLLNEGTQ